jgi:hypothetical protein
MPRHSKQIQQANASAIVQHVGLRNGRKKRLHEKPKSERRTKNYGRVVLGPNFAGSLKLGMFFISDDIHI